MSYRAIFVDRDGTVSEEIGYMYHAGLYKPYPWTGPAIRRINENGMKSVLITNQSGVGRGYFDEASVEEVHAILQAELARHQAKLDGIYVCPHHPEANCQCRKPRPGMVLQAARDLDLDLTGSFVIGDKFVDVALAYAVGARAVLVLTGYGRDELERHKDQPQQPHLIAENLLDAVESILSGKVT